MCGVTTVEQRHSVTGALQLPRTGRTDKTATDDQCSLHADRVLRKIRELSRRDAPGLESAVVQLRTNITANGDARLTCKDWLAGFFA